MFVLCVFARGAAAQAPKFPTAEPPVRAEIADALAKFPQALEDAKQRAQRFVDMAETTVKLTGQFPPHPWQCRYGAEVLGDRKYRESKWIFDSTRMVADAIKFQECFEANTMPDMPEPPLCIPVVVIFGKVIVEICYDPPSAAPLIGGAISKLPVGANCCPQTKELIKLCGVNKDNRGFNLEHWWPEHTAQVNNYGVASFDPAWECGNDEYYNEPLLKFLRDYVAFTTGKKANMPDIGWPEPMRLEPNIGQTHWAGEQPGDQTFHAEAHVYRNYLAALSMVNNDDPRKVGWEGFKKNCQCFYATTQPRYVSGKRERKMVNGWTEVPMFFPYWRTFQFSGILDKERYRAIENFRDPFTDACASFRAYHPNWAESYFYKDLRNIGIKPPRIRDYLARICYRGGGELFPITGQLMGVFSPVPASAYIARRALYLFGKDEVAGGRFMTPERRIAKYSDSVDKMQRIYPGQEKGLRVGQCFRGHEIPNSIQETGATWQRDIISDPYDKAGWLIGGPLDDVRFAYWNRRKACMCPYIGPVMGVRIMQRRYVSCRQIQPSCRSKDEGDFEDDPKAELDAYGGPKLRPIYAPPVVDGIPFPFLPDFGYGVYTLDNGSQCPLRKGGPTNKLVPEEVYACKNNKGRCEK